MKPSQQPSAFWPFCILLIAVLGVGYYLKDPPSDTSEVPVALETGETQVSNVAVDMEPASFDPVQQEISRSAQAAVPIPVREAVTEEKPAVPSTPNPVASNPIAPSPVVLVPAAAETASEVVRVGTPTQVAENTVSQEEQSEEDIYWEEVRQLAENGDAEAQFAMGQATDQEFEVSNEWYLKAAEQGHVDALLTMAVRYATGKGVEQDLDEAARLLELAEHGGVQEVLVVGRERGVRVQPRPTQGWPPQPIQMPIPIYASMPAVQPPPVMQTNLLLASTPPIKVQQMKGATFVAGQPASASRSYATRTAGAIQASLAGDRLEMYRTLLRTLGRDGNTSR